MNNYINTKDFPADGYIDFAGFTNSPNDGDVSGCNTSSGTNDVWLVRLDNTTGINSLTTNINQVYPNPFNKILRMNYKDYKEQ